MNGRSAGDPAVIVQPIYKEFAPIGTCHFQNMANILEARGLVDAKRRICLSWGFRWRNHDGVLHGGDRWTELANQAYGLALRRASFPDWQQASTYEHSLLAAHAPFVAEVDAYAVPSPYYHKEHVVHTVIVLARENDWTTLLDASNDPAPARYPELAYRNMRSAECAGRLEPYALYAFWPTPIKNADSTTILSVFRAAVTEHWAEDVASLDAYIAFIEDTQSYINVCRVAAERLYVATLFEMLSEDHPSVAPFAERFAALAERWYLLHMLTSNEGAARRPQHMRIVRLLRELRSWEVALATDVQDALAREPGRRFTESVQP